MSTPLPASALATPLAARTRVSSLRVHHVRSAADGPWSARTVQQRVPDGSGMHGDIGRLASVTPSASSRSARGLPAPAAAGHCPPIHHQPNTYGVSGKRRRGGQAAGHVRGRVCVDVPVKTPADVVEAALKECVFWVREPADEGACAWFATGRERYSGWRCCAVVGL